MTSINLARGQRVGLKDIIACDQDFQLEVTCKSPGLVIDFSSFGLDEKGSLSDDRYMTFFNQKVTPCGGVSIHNPAGDIARFQINLKKLPAAISRLALAAAIDGPGAMRQVSSGYVCFLVRGIEVARFAFSGSDFADERALILIEIYRKDNSWRMSAIGQGFNGGLASLVKHFGGTVNEMQPADSGLRPTLTASLPLPIPKLSLEKKLEKHAPQLVDLAKKATVSLEKNNLIDIVARVGLVLDASGSMHGQYASGRVQEVVDRILPLAVHFDDDGAIDCWAFAEKAQELPAVTVKNVKNYVDKEKGGWMKWMNKLNASINYEPAVMRQVISKYKSGFFSQSMIPAYVIFISDGGVGSDDEIEQLIIESSKQPIFWQFVGIGGSYYGILERFDTMPGRYLDNCNFFSIDDLHSISDQELYDRILNEFPSWLKEARAKKVIS